MRTLDQLETIASTLDPSEEQRTIILENYGYAVPWLDIEQIARKLTLH